MLAGGVSLWHSWAPGRQAPGAGPLFDLQGHRGARGHFPENSLPGFEGALAIGVTTLEMDLGLTRDDVVVVHHDRRLNPWRTRGPGGAWLEEPTPALTDLGLAELQSYDIGRLHPEAEARERFPEQAGMEGVPVPTLAEVMAAAEALSDGRTRYNVETKISPLSPEDSPDPEAFVKAVIAVVDGAGARERVTLQSFDWRSLAIAAELAPDIRRVYLTAEQSWLDNLQRGQPGTSPWTNGLDLDNGPITPPQAIARLGGAIWSPYFRDLRPGDLDEAHKLGLKVIVWTVNETADMESLIAAGVDGIITDYPQRLRAVLEQLGRPLPTAFGD